MSTPMEKRTVWMSNRNRRMALRNVLVALTLLGLAACDLGSGPGPVTGAGPVAPPDPVAVFAASAQPGGTAGIVLADGRPATVRLLRSYHAASGRECREVQVNAGLAAGRQLVCEMDGGGWASVRPLLRGGGVARP